MRTWFDTVVPEQFPWTHTLEGADDMPAHVKASLTGPELTLPVRDGRLALGTWQGIYLCEHRDHGGARRVVATLSGRGGLAALPDRVALLLEGDRALARVLGDQDRPRDLALAVPEVRLRPVPLLVRIVFVAATASGPLRRDPAGELERDVHRGPGLGDAVDEPELERRARR